MVERSDAEVLRAGESDPDAIAIFYRRHLSPVLGYFMARTRDPALSADLTAETFAAALATGHRLRPGCAITNWLYLLARTVLTESLRGAQVESRRRRALGMPSTLLTREDIRRIDRVWSVQEGRPLTLLENLPGRVQEVLAAPITAQAQRTIGFELGHSDRLSLPIHDEPASAFLDRVEQQLVDAAGRGVHLPWHRRIRWRGQPARHVDDRSGTS